MGFKKCAAVKGKVTMAEGAQKEAEFIYLYDMITKIETHKIPHQLILTQIEIQIVSDTPRKNLQVNLWQTCNNWNVYHRFRGKFPPEATDLRG